jgi:sterol 24-C-methyltransferase
MSIKLSRGLKDHLSSSGVARTIRDYERRLREGRGTQTEDEVGDHRQLNDLYYNLVTDFFEYGWGRSFHFAPRTPGQSFKESLALHERNMADALNLRPNMVVADLGCGVGGPLLEIAGYSGARVIGVNSNSYQLERARRYAEEAGLADLADFLECDFLSVDAADESFDAVYSIEATCCAPDKLSVYSEAFRLLKPGACFGAYEYCLTHRYDAGNPDHLKLKADMERGGGLLVIDEAETIDNALRAAGFDVLETRDLAVQAGLSVPWYQPLVGSGLSFASFRSSNIGRWLTHITLFGLEALRIAPKGTAEVSDLLNLGALGFAEAGRLGIFTPMYFIHARKPDRGTG